MQWIPIGRAYPTKFEEIIYSTADRIEIGFYNGSSWNCYNLGMIDDMSTEHDEVIAWMELPNPYKTCDLTYGDILNRFYEKYPEYKVKHSDYRPIDGDNSIIIWFNDKSSIRVKYHDDTDIFELLGTTNRITGWWYFYAKNKREGCCYEEFNKRRKRTFIKVRL